MSGRRTFTTIAEPVTRGPNKPPALGSDPTAGGPLDAFPGPGPAAVRRSRGAPASRSPPAAACSHRPQGPRALPDRKSTRLNSSHGYISYAVFCLKKKKNTGAHRIVDGGKLYSCRPYLLPHYTQSVA